MLVDMVVLFVAAFLAFIFFVYFVLPRFIDSGVGAINRKVQGTKHAAGIEFLETQSFFPTDQPVAELTAALRSGVKAADSAPLAMAALYIQSVENDRIDWAYGKKLTTSFHAVAMVGVTANLADGSSQRGVIFAITEGTEVSGIVDGVSAMRALAHDVEAAIRSVDPAATRIVLGV